MNIITTLYERYKQMPRMDRISITPIKVTEKELKEYHLELLKRGLKSINKFNGRELIVEDDKQRTSRSSL